MSEANPALLKLFLAVALLLPTAEPKATIRGRITNSQGQPVAGATVWGGNIAQIAKPIPGIVCAVTDADGRYEITDMSPADIDDLPPMAMPFGRWQMESFILTADHPDYAPGKWARAPLCQL